VHDALARRIHRSGDFSAIQETLKVGAPLPVYTLGPERLLANRSLSAATRMGWRYPIVDGAKSGLATVFDGDGALKFAGLSFGENAQRLLQAAAIAENELAGRAERFEPRLLEIPSLQISALWLYGGRSFFVPIVDGYCLHPQSLRLEDDIESRISAALIVTRRSRADVRPASLYGMLRKNRHIRLFLAFAATALLSALIGAGFAVYFLHRGAADSL
jgi:hypothetical protein